MGDSHQLPPPNPKGTALSGEVLSGLCINGLIPPHPPYNQASKETGGLEQVLDSELLPDLFVLSDVLLAAFQEASDFMQDLLAQFAQLAVGEQVLGDKRGDPIPHHLQAELRVRVDFSAVQLKGLTQQCAYVFSSIGCTQGPTLVIKQAKPRVRRYRDGNPGL